MLLLKKISLLLLLLAGISFGNALDVDDLDQINSHKYFARKTEEFLVGGQNKLSSLCSYALGEYAKGLSTGQMWTLQMFDAASKIPSGILDGNFIDLGTFDQCMNIEGTINGTTPIYGRYCLATLILSTPAQKTNHHTNVANLFGRPNPRAGGALAALPLQLATCMPSVCSPQDIQDFYSGIGVPMAITETMCQTKEEQPNLDAGAIATISVFGVILWIIVASTIYDTVLHYLKAKPVHQLLTAFSLLTNGKKLLATSSSGQISCMHGIRVISTMWVILGHRYSISSSFPMKNMAAVLDWSADEANMFIIGGTVSVDTFFVMGGIVLAYSFLGAMEKKVKFNIILYYLHRYLRLTPALAVVIVIHITLLKYFGSGPIYPAATDSLIVACKESWWKALLYIQNYGNMDIVCIPQSWYLSVDMQLFLISPFILVPLAKFPTLTLIVTGALTVASIIACFVTGWVYEINGQIMAITTVESAYDFMRLYYSATHTRAAAWLIGILFGYLIFKIHQRRTRITINKGIILLLWTISLTVLCVCLYCGHNLIADYDRLASSFYIALVRPAWAVGCGWVILACAVGYGGPINWFLSMPIFQVLSKLTYSLYLVHYVVIYLVSGSMRVSPWFSNGEWLYIFWGDFVFTLVGSAMLTLAFESPMITIEKFLFGGGGKKPSGKQTELPRNRPIDPERNQPNQQTEKVPIDLHDNDNTSQRSLRDDLPANSTLDQRDIEKGVTSSPVS